MNMSLREAAIYLNTTKRRVRYLVEKNELSARKVDGCWLIDKKALDALPSVARKIAQKQRRARRIVDEVLGPDQESPYFSVLDLRAFTTARDLCRQLSRDHAAFSPLLECLQALVCGCHAFASTEKRRFFGSAREQAARALAFLLLDSEPDEAATRLESQLIPAISGLIRGQERRKK